MVVILDNKNAAPNLTSDEIVNTVTQILLTDEKFANGGTLVRGAVRPVLPRRRASTSWSTGSCRGLPTCSS